MTRFLVLAVAVAGVAEKAHAQYTLDGRYVGPEYFYVENNYPTPVRVVVIPIESSNRPEWRFSVAANDTSGIQLVYRQPYHITVWRSDGAAYVMDKAYLCRGMEECRSQGQPYKNIRKTVTANVWTKAKPGEEKSAKGSQKMVQRGKIGTLSERAFDHFTLIVGPPKDAKAAPRSDAMFFRDQPGNPPIYIGGERQPQSRAPAVEVPKSTRHRFEP